MVVRIWSVHIAEGRIDEFERYIRENTASMFREQSGLVASVRARDHHEWRTITLWSEPESAEAMDQSPSYVGAVQGLVEAGLIQGEASTEIFQLRGALVPDPQELLELLGT